MMTYIGIGALLVGCFMLVGGWQSGVKGKLMGQGLILIINIVTSLQYSFSTSAIVNLAILIAAFVLSQKSSGGTVFDTKDTSSEAAKVQAQTEKQTSIYDEQLRNGILTQEEYDQIMKNNK